MNSVNVPVIAVDFVLAPVINFAMQQNHVPVVRELVIRNISQADLNNLSIQITSEPGFALSWVQPVDILRVGDAWAFESVRIDVSPKFLAELTERLTGRFTLTVLAAGQTLFENRYDVDLLAYDQWNGVGLLPEMLAAFITPNHPEIPQIIRNAAAILAKWTGSPSFDEYQSRNPDRVRKQMAAIYEAIADMELIYVSVPASFEESGQRVRLSDAILSQRLANCLDLSLLYAACLEAVGIHPLVMIVKGHAFAGAWLIDESFADPVNDDPSLISKRTAQGINDIAILECTCMNAGKRVPFDEAVRLAESKMLNTDNFHLFMDVKRARFGGIRPLPLRIATPTGWEIKADDFKTNQTNFLPEDIVVGQKLVSVNHIDLSKQRLWERKLLDLTLRNNLLNTRLTKSAIQFLTVSLAKLEDALADGKEFQVLGKPADWDNTLRDVGIYQAIHATDPVAELVRHELTHQRLRTYLNEADLNYSLTALYRASRLSMEENGANTLYIGLGLLKWYETEASERPRFAPILLMPVEIVRKTAKSGYIIRNREEETMVNITLLEMLRQDFGITIGGLDVLPKDESGVDVRTIFNIIRQSIMTKARWDVEEQAILGTFSFSKFILWNDIHNNAGELAKNDVVASLISGRLEQSLVDDLSGGSISDADLHPESIALPISTDSSQLQAIVSSGQGKSFVLHGPPGTGKSQTITNIIANALYAGKRVLFVASKKAALEVVESRLQAIGIGNFCLELHSNKSKKSEVLEQLKRATMAVKKPAPEYFTSTADRLFGVRSDLNTYVEALHQKHPIGYSLFDLFSGYVRLSGTPGGEVYFQASLIEKLNEDKLHTWDDITGQLQSIVMAVSAPATHPLRAMRPETYTPQLKTEAKQLIEQFKAVLLQFGTAVNRVSALLQLDGAIQSEEQVLLLAEIARLLQSLPDSPPSFIQAESIEQTLAQVIGLAAHGQQRDVLRQQLLQQFTRDILTYPAARTLTEWNMASEKWFLPRWLQHRAIAKTLKQLATTGTVEDEHIPAILQNIIACQAEQQLIDEATFLPGLLGFLWQSGNCDWQNLIQVSNTYIQLNRLVAKALGLPLLKDWRSKFAGLIAEGSQAYLSAHDSELKQFLALFNQLKQCEAGLLRLLMIDYSVTDNLPGNWINNLVTQCDEWLQGLDLLKDWYHYHQIKTAALEAGLAPLITAYETGEIKNTNLLTAYKKGLYKSAAEHIIALSPQLATFNSELFEGKIKRFRELSLSFEQQTRDELYARLAAKIPSFSQEASQSSEMGLLQRTIRNNGRAMPIRKLFDSIPNLLPRLTPCMLMSPISVAQYFDASSPKFDLVVFDEASQMPTCEAVGAIARGNSVIVVGDPKQMPPTSFFSANNIDEDNIEKEDLESILDDCLALSMPSHHLLWHYRSKHESLIAFSNAKYYDNNLLTFPSTDDISSKVQYVHVKGFYDKGKSRQNRFEAKAIVDEIVLRLSDPLLARKSIGVVTFSSVQQTLVEDLLTEVFQLRPDLEKIAMDGEEPIFIKNLENVQGDERDVILFSIGYGPDENGRVSLNFGPINRDGGWRRLNVAVTRARYEMKVFATLTSDQIDLNRTSSEGVAGLKAFLAYAEKGKQALPLRALNGSNQGQGFEELLAAEIRQHGYEVHTHIGCSAYKIDLGIVNPQNPAQYLLALLGDGETYYNARTSSDREIVQVGVLKTLGWNVYKVWSTEWWENPGKVIAEIMEAIHHAEQGIAPEPKLDLSDTPLPQEEEELEVEIEETITIDLSPGTVPVSPYRHLYEVATVEFVVTASTEEFFLQGNRAKIKAQIAQVLRVESPISKNLLAKRVLAGWSISRMGARVSNHFEVLFHELDLKQTTDGAKTIFWKHDHHPDQYHFYRVAHTEAQKREADDLPLHEVANGIKDILRNQISLSKTDLVKEASKLFGYARIGSNVENAMLQAIDKTIKNGVGRLENERVVYEG
ncbi:DUF3320 domain-containing protein [Mucilaginibacter paludis]|uniref:DNA helicase n=1 Tax=Mucilaginibacter paludis DSM 18603 TaxID=714943 RepID=H1YFP1_9SPHI|nr:DUF3320 domain-containing protein [Mucilaginibacter paludis]EHQ24443.1 putative DNA helicase [Mucilaginibacter paludis DSM 18603]